MLIGQEPFCACQWWQKTFGLISELLILGNLLGSFDRVLGHLDADGIFQQSFLDTNIGQSGSFCPHIMGAKHGPPSVLRMVKNLAWQQNLPLHKIVGFQLLNHLLKLLVNGLAGVQDVTCQNCFCTCFTSQVPTYSGQLEAAKGRKHS